MMTPSEFEQRLVLLPDASGSRHLSLNGFQHAAVLVPIVKSENGYNFLFTKRTERVETHKGQVSFPGGVVDDTDVDVIAAALREAEEEIGVSKGAVKILGVLDDLATPTGFVITPVIGFLDTLPSLTPNTEEVDEVFEVPVGFFAEQGNGRAELKKVAGIEREIWYYTTGSHTIWGATAAIIRSLLQTMQLL